MTRYLYCPIEVGTRELFARFLTACVAAEQDFTVLIGFQYTLLEHATVLPKGIYLSKGTNALSVQNLRMVRDNGHAVAMCEEENFFRGLKGNPIAIGDPLMGDVCNLYLAIGEDERDYVTSRFASAFPVVCTGNARADILRPQFRSLFESEAEQIRAQHGPHILFNTNFGIINNATPENTPQTIFDEWAAIGVFSESLTDEEKAHVFEDYKSFEQCNIRTVKKVLRQLAELGHRVVIRPHPVENVETWKKEVQKIDSENVRLATQGNHIPAILAADLVVHTACTTGVEALILDVPALCVSATDNQAVSFHLARKFNDTVTSVEAAVKAIDSHMNGTAFIMRNRKKYLNGLAHYLYALDPAPLAAEEIVTKLVHLAESWSGRFKFGQGQARALKILQESETFTNDNYFRQKLGLTPGIIDSTFGALQNCLNRFHDIRCEQLSETVYKISK